MLEVHRWRGSPERRAFRAQVRKLGQFAYFSQQLGHPDWRNRRVLDFGGTDGNLLWNPDCAIRHVNYYCLDVVRDAIDEGRAAFPEAHWIHYDRYNCSFNPLGIVNLPIPDLGTHFDIILAYSVFTHTTREEMHELVDELRTRLAPGGTLAFTFEEPESNLQERLEAIREENAAVDVDGLLAQSRDAAWCALVNDEGEGNGRGPALTLDGNGVWSNEEAEQCMTYDVYYTVAFMQREFPDAIVLPPVNGESQHCCILRRA